MEFDSSQPIYLQIADMISEKILSGTWKEKERIPSVRDLATSIQVNPNTVMRTYAYLEDKGIISNQRGIGFSITADGFKATKSMRINRFVKSELVSIFRTMELLELTFDDLKTFYHDYSLSKLPGR